MGKQMAPQPQSQIQLRLLNQSVFYLLCLTYGGDGHGEANGTPALGLDTAKVTQLVSVLLAFLCLTYGGDGHGEANGAPALELDTAKVT